MAIKKVMGTETEYGIFIRNSYDLDLISQCILVVNSYRPEQLCKLLWDYDLENPLVDARGFKVEGVVDTPSQKDNMALNKVLPNGARYYVDHAHPEYSTPECTNPRDVVIYEKAGEKILMISRHNANSILPRDQQILIYKNNSDQKGNSYGSHENYLMSRDTPFQRIKEKLIPFLVTRQIYAGSGKVGSENNTDEVDYQISQRADFFETDVGLDTMVKRPIINTRDEPHADREKYRRLHVIVGDSNMSEYTIYLKLGVTAIVLKMIEDDFIKKEPSLKDPVRALKDISRDPSCKLKVPLEDGRSLTAIEIQKIYLELAHSYFQGRALDPIEKDILDKWEYVLKELEYDPMQLDRHIDWIIKRHLITSYMSKKGCSWKDPRVLMIDLQYHDIREDKGLFYLLQKEGKVERIVREEEIIHAIDNPPQDTRAYFRGMCIKKYKNEVFGVNWDSISFNIGEQSIKRILMAEPLKGTKSHVYELIENSATARDLVNYLSS